MRERRSSVQITKSSRRRENQLLREMKGTFTIIKVILMPSAKMHSGMAIHKSENQT